MIRQTLLGLAVAIAPTLVAAHSKSEATTPADGATVTEVPELQCGSMTQCGSFQSR